MTDARLSQRSALMRPSALREMMSTNGPPPRLSLAGGLPPREAFPFATLAEIATELLTDGMRPKLCYLCTNFSNPSGATLSGTRRQHLAELSRRYGFVIVEDDQYGRLRFRG